METGAGHDKVLLNLAAALFHWRKIKNSHGVVLILAVVLALPPGSAAAVPFQVGEKLTYALYWMFVPAGEAVLEVRPGRINGQEAFHFVLQVRSNAVVDAFYKVRDHVEAFADKGLSRSLGYRKDQQEGRTRRQVEVVFDWQRQTARYADFGRAIDPIAVTTGTFDPLSVLFYLRTLALDRGMAAQRPVTDGKKCVAGRAVVLDRQRLGVAGNAYDTFKVAPELAHIGGIFEKSPKAKIHLWVTADHRRIPVKVESAVIVGRFTAELIAAEGLAP
jgi:hypothetical protein